MNWNIDESEARRLLLDLVSIDSVNPSLVPGGAGEEQVARYIAEYTKGLGFSTRLDPVAPGRPNVVAVMGGGASSEKALTQRHGLIINGHTDVVGVQGMIDPFRPRVEGDEVFARGAADMKNGLVAGLLAMKAVQDSGIPLSKSVLFTGAVDEEYASIGTEDVAKRYDADAALVMDGGPCPCIAHKGFAWVTVETLGKAAHGSNYDEGVDAVSMMGRFLARVDALNAIYEAEPKHPLCGRKSIHASLIEGGKELSTYPNYCRARFERRTLPKEDPSGIVDEFSAIIRDLQAQDPRFDARLTLDFVRNGYEIAPDHPLVKTLTIAIREVTQDEAPLVGAYGWLDSAVLGAKGIPTVIYGVGGDGAHDVVESCFVSDIVKCANVVADLIVRLCGA